MARIIETATSPIDKGDVDPVTLDLIENGLRNARYELDEVLFRTALRAGDVITGPAIVVEMDSTTLVLPDHAATVHASGSLLINPVQEA